MRSYGDRPEVFTGGEMPEPDTAIPTGRGDGLAVRADRYSMDRRLRHEERLTFSIPIRDRNADAVVCLHFAIYRPMGSKCGGVVAVEPLRECLTCARRESFARLCLPHVDRGERCNGGIFVHGWDTFF